MEEISENNKAETSAAKRSGRYIYNASFIMYFGIMLALVFLRLLFMWGAFDGVSDDAANYIFTFVSQILILGLAPLLLIACLFKKGFKGTLEYLQVKKPKPYIFLAFAIGIAGFVAYNMFLNAILNIIYSAIGWHGGGGAITHIPVWQLFVEILFFSVFPAVCEEIAHRGMVFRAMKEGGESDAKIIWMSGLFFGLFHMALGQTVFAMVMGFIAALLVVKSKSIVPAVILHFTNNFIVSVVRFIYSRLPDGGASGSVSAGIALLIFLLYIAATVALILLILLFIKRARKAGDCPPKIKQNQFMPINAAVPPFAPGIQLSAQPTHASAPIRPQSQGGVPPVLFAPLNPYAPPTAFNPYAPPNTPPAPFNPYAPPQAYSPYFQPLAAVRPPAKPRRKKIIFAKDKIFYYAAILLAGLITVVSFVNGL